MPEQDPCKSAMTRLAYIYIYIYALRARFALGTVSDMHANSPGASTEGTPEVKRKEEKRRKELTWDGGWGEKSGLAAEDIRGREASVGW